MKQNTAPERTLRTPSRSVPWLAGLSAASALIHAAVVQEHLSEYLPFGIAFAAMALFQAGWAFAALGWGASRRALLVAAIANAAIVVLWALSRTSGLPIGPEPGTPEAAGVLDLIATLYEVALVIGCVSVRSGVRVRPIAGRVARSAVDAGAASGVTLLTFLAIVAGHGDREGHEGHVLLLAAGVVAFAAWAALDVRANGRPRFSWRLRPDDPVQPVAERVPAA